MAAVPVCNDSSAPYLGLPEGVNGFLQNFHAVDEGAATAAGSGALPAQVLAQLGLQARHPLLQRPHPSHNRRIKTPLLAARTHQAQYKGSQKT